MKKGKKGSKTIYRCLHDDPDCPYKIEIYQDERADCVDAYKEMKEDWESGKSVIKSLSYVQRFESLDEVPRIKLERKAEAKPKVDYSEDFKEIIEAKPGCSDKYCQYQKNQYPRTNKGCQCFKDLPTKKKAFVEKMFQLFDKIQNDPNWGVNL